jgi:hypothetical protein
VTANKDVATSWLEQLAARGVAVVVRNGRLAYRPKSAYSSLSDAERATLRQHKRAIIARVTAGPPVQVAAPTPSEGVAPTPALAPEPCRFCMRACVGRDHPAFAIFHAADEQEQWRRRAEQRERDYQEWELRRRYGLPPPTWDI